MNKLIFGCILLLITFTGCNQKPVEISQFQNKVPEKVCIVKHEAVLHEDFLLAVQKGFEDNNTETKIINGIYKKQDETYRPTYKTTINNDDLEGCDAIVGYVASWLFAFPYGTYMDYANIWITDLQEENKIAQVTYNSYGRWNVNAKSRVLDLINQLYGKETQYNYEEKGIKERPS